MMCVSKAMSIFWILRYVNTIELPSALIRDALACSNLTHAPNTRSLFQGTLLALVSSMGYVDADGNFPRARLAFCTDALATIFGSLFGLSPVTAFIESGAGVEAGSRTGLTAVLCGLFFFMSIFFAPIIASIPPWATGGSLVIVGALMAKSLGEVKWYDVTHASTAFITVMVRLHSVLYE
jgi:xanthine/uracil/vitamin C permease (AzgA family)